MLDGSVCMVSILRREKAFTKCAFRKIFIQTATKGEYMQQLCLTTYFHWYHVVYISLYFGVVIGQYIEKPQDCFF